MDNKRVDILTFHWTINFGGLLQAYALQETVTQLGYDASFINYHNTQELASVVNWKRRIIQKVWDKVARIAFGREKREELTKYFRKQFLNIQEKEVTNYDELKNLYMESDTPHAGIVGSDQVWNPDLTGSPDAYLLSFLPDSSRKIAYAASFGKASIPQNCTDQFKNELLKFNAISVREDSGVDLVKCISGRDAKLVMDPVFLLNRNSWCRLLRRPKANSQYVLCYYMNTNDRSEHMAIKEIATYLARKYKLKIVNIGKKEFERIKIWENNVFDIGPREFLTLIFNAKYVVTNSFHATSFSCIFNIPFFVPVNYHLPEDKRLSNRMESLARRFGCIDRMIPCPVCSNNVQDKIDSLCSMDFTQVDNIISKQRIDSLNFIKSTLDFDGGIV